MPRKTHVPSERSVSAEVGASQLTVESSTVREAGGMAPERMGEGWLPRLPSLPALSASFPLLGLKCLPLPQ